MLIATGCFLLGALATWLGVRVSDRLPLRAGLVMWAAIALVGALLLGTLAPLSRVVALLAAGGGLPARGAGSRA